MPIPKPRKGEAQDDFISRCHSATAEEFPDDERRNAMCFRQWREKDKKNATEVKVNAAGTSAEIMLYEDVGGYFGGITAKRLIDDIKAAGSLEHINLRINSAGGDVSEGVAIFNYLRDHKARVEVDIDGWALSIASLVAMAGDHVRIAENALMMVHEPWTVVQGNAAELRKQAELMDKVREKVLIPTYARKTGMSGYEIAGFLEEETWMSAEEALQAHFVDEVTESRRMAAHGDISRFKHPPERAFELLRIEDTPNKKTIDELLARRARRENALRRHRI